RPICPIDHDRFVRMPMGASIAPSLEASPTVPRRRTPVKRLLALIVGAVVLGALIPAVDAAQVASAVSVDVNRHVEAVVMTGQRFPYFLANKNSTFSVYSWTDEELTYQWDQEAWRKVGVPGSNSCTAAYPPAANDPSSYMKGQYPSTDPVPGLDNDDEVSFYWS